MPEFGTSDASPSDALCVLSGRDRRRSGDPALFRRVLCRLSYPTVVVRAYPARRRRIRDAPTKSPTVAATAPSVTRAATPSKPALVVSVWATTVGVVGLPAAPLVVVL